MWRQIFLGQVLVTNRSVFLISSRNHGIVENFVLFFAQKYYNYNVNDQAQLVMKLMDTIEVYSNIHILAHDFGDTVAQELMRLNRSVEVFVIMIETN